MKVKKYASLLLICLLLAACSSKIEEEKIGSTVYIAEKVQFKSTLDEVESACISGDMVYLLGTVRSNDTFEEALTLVRVPLEGGKEEELPAFQPVHLEGDKEYGAIGGYLRSGTDGTLWLTEDIYIPGDGVSQVLRQLDSEGNELSSFDSTLLRDELGAERFYDLWSDGSGTYLVNTGDAVILLDGGGSVRAVLEGGSMMFNRFVTLSDGRTAIMDVTQNMEGYTSRLRVIDIEAGSWAEEAFPVTFDARCFQTGEGETFFRYQDGDALYAWHQGAAEAERLMSWAESGVDASSLTAFMFLSDGRLAAVTGSQAGSRSRAMLSILTPTEASALPERTVLTLATLGEIDSDLSAMIADFNSSSSFYISVTEYVPDYPYSATDWNQARLRMITALSAGKMPDILCLRNGLPIRGMESRGMLVDLWPYIDADPELERDDLMLRPLEAMEYKGGLYCLMDSFKIDTLTGAKDVVGDQLTWTYDDFLTAWKTMPEGSTATGVYDSKHEMLRALMERNVDHFIDWEQGISRFGEDEFRALLEFCRQFPDEPDLTLFLEPVYWGEQMLQPYGIASFQNLQEYKALFGTEVSFVGWPNNEGWAGSTFAMIGAPLAISASSEHKEEAWSFLRQLLLPSEEVSLQNAVSSPTSFPINRSDFERMAELSMVPQMRENNGEQESPAGYISIQTDGESLNLPYYALTREEYDQLMALYNAAEGTGDYDVNLINIITEQAEVYFAGDRSLDDTVAAIQSRVELYLAELQ